MRDISLYINGRKRRIVCDPEKPLLDVLREDLGLTGAKRGCARGQCGTCAVIMDGRVVMACKTSIMSARGRRVTTIEGLGTPESPHPLQLAFSFTGAIQCGFCTPGLIIRSKVLLDENPEPSREEIAKALTPHLCRCTGYQKIFEAVELASAVMSGKREMPPLATMGRLAIGGEVNRHDALEKACGVTEFAEDIALAGALHLAVVRSPLDHARVNRIDPAEALGLPGVKAVLTADDVPGANILKMAGDDQPLLCRDKVRFRGDALALVAADSPRAALDGAGLVKLDLAELPPVASVEQSLAQGAPLVHEDRENLMFHQPVVYGQAAEGFAKAAVVVEADYHTQAVEHAYLEPDCGLAYMNHKGELVVMSGGQNIYQHRKTICHALGLDPAQVRVVQTPTGGAFGGKLDVSAGGFLALAALTLKRPVRMAYSREEVFAATTKRHPFAMEMKLAAAEDGRLIALSGQFTADAGAYASFSKSVMTRGLVHASGPYRWQHAELAGRAAYTTSAVKGAMRGFGAPQTAFAMECAMDELAHKLGMDPLELRLKNAFVSGDQTIFGQTLTDADGLVECLTRMRPHYQRALAEARDRREAGVKRGVGLAAVWFGPGRSAPDQSEAWAELLPNDDLQVWIASADMGQGSDTMFWQVAAQAFGYPLERVHLCTTDTGHCPDGNFSAGSRQTYVSGKAVELAVAELKAAMEKAGAKGFDDLKQKGLPTRYQVVHQTHTTKLDPETGHGVPWETYSFGVQMAEVEVDLDKKKIRPLRITAVHDMGVVINRINLEGQLHGGIAMGMGYALSEDFVYGKSDSFAKYRIPRAKDMPELVVEAVEIPRTGGPFGASGAGEFADVPTAPALANAVFNACGQRLRSLPLKLA